MIDEKRALPAQRYTGADLALLIPTKDRPEKLRNLLSSIAAQDVVCGRVIVVDGGESARNVTDAFDGRLDIDYTPCRPPGQIRQRNLGISRLTPENRLVGFLDDDLVLEPGAVAAMIDCWNRVAPETAGIGFNIVNTPPHRYSVLKGLLLLDGPTQGKVMKTSLNVDIHHLEGDIRTQWLGGGYTVWRKAVIISVPNHYVRTRWAIGEDLNYSYPIGKTLPLYVCAAARVRHEHVYDQAPPDSVHRYRGRQVMLARMRFVLRHQELSRVACLWMLLMMTIGKGIIGLIRRDRNDLAGAAGQLIGVGLCVLAACGIVDVDRLMTDR